MPDSSARIDGRGFTALAFLARREKDGEVVSQPPAAPQRLRGKVLVVDDEEALRDIVSARLSFVADEVRVAADGVVAWQLIEQDPPDVLVTDLSMPERSGEELCRMVRDSVHGKNLWILILTARRGVKRRVEGLDLGADDYLEKPFDLDELAARVRVGLRMRALQRELETSARHAAIGWVAYALGHEIRNPLAVILANANVLEEVRPGIAQLWKVASRTAHMLEGEGRDEEARALREAAAPFGGMPAILDDLSDIGESTIHLVRRATAAVAALQRFAEGASGRPADCDPLVLVEDAVQLAFAGAEIFPTIDSPRDLPVVRAVPRDVVLALATALGRARGERIADPLPRIEVMEAPRCVVIRVDGPGDGTSPSELLNARIADHAPGEKRAGLDVGLAHAVVALRAAGAGLSVGISERGGIAVEILLPRGDEGTEAEASKPTPSGTSSP